MIALLVGLQAVGFTLLWNGGFPPPLEWAAFAFPIGVDFAIVGIFGVLFVLGSQDLATRLFEFVCGLVLICALLILHDAGSLPFSCGLVGVTSVVATFVLVLCRHNGAALRTVAKGDQIAHHQPLQFSVKHLFLCGLCVAVLLRIGQFFQPYLELRIIFGFGLAFAIVAVAAPWAALARTRALLRCAIVVLLAGTVGVLAGFNVRHQQAPDLWLFGFMSATQGLVTLLSLALLRPSGLRLVRIRPKPQPNNSEPSLSPPC